METRQITNDLSNIGRESGAMIKDKASAFAEKAKATGAQALASAKNTYSVAQDKAIAGARLTDSAIRERPYQALGVVFGVGVILGWLLSRRD